MKKKLLLGLLLIISLVVVTGCDSKVNEDTNKEETKKTEKKELIANTQVGILKYYVPGIFEYHSELRGLIYNENSRKVHVKGDVTDYSEALFIDVYVVDTTLSLTSYIESVNNKLTDNDVKLTFYKDIVLKKGTASIYIRDNFTLKSNGVETTNYAYFTSKDGAVYCLHIHGPKSKEEEVKSLADDVVSSIEFQ